MDDETFAEAIEWALETFPQLRKVGESAEYLGGFKFRSGSMKYRRMSYLVASFGKKVGVNLLRPNSKALTQVLHPLPPGINLAVTNKLSYKNSKHLPSVAVADTRKRVRSFARYVDQHSCEKCLFLTLPASKHRVKVAELNGEIDLYFERVRQFEQALTEMFGDAVEIASLRLELPYDPESRTFHPHFHAIATWNEELNIEDFQTWLREYIIRAGFCSVSCEASVVDRCHVGRVVSYIFKPCLAAHKMAQAGHAEEFRLFVGEVKKRVSRTRGAFAAFEKKRKAASKAEKSNQCKARKNMHREKDGFDEEASEPCIKKLPDGVPSEPQNILCGVSDSVTLPGGRKGVWSTVKNFTPSPDGMPNRFGNISTVDVVNAAAMERWEANAGCKYSLKEFIRPFAKELKDLLDQSNVQYCTITCSPEIVTILQEINCEEAIAKRRTGNSAVKQRLWPKFRRTLKWVWFCPGSLLRLFQRWLTENPTATSGNALPEANQK